MEGDKGDILSIAANWKPLFLLKVKIKQSPDCLCKEYNAVFQHICRNIRAFLKYKKICIDQWLRKFWREESEQSKTSGEGWKPLTNATKSFILSVAGVQDMPLYTLIFRFRFARMQARRHAGNDLCNFSLSNFQNYTDQDQSQYRIFSWNNIIAPPFTASSP